MIALERFGKSLKMRTSLETNFPINQRVNNMNNQFSITMITVAVITLL